MMECLSCLLTSVCVHWFYRNMWDSSSSEDDFDIKDVKKVGRSPIKRWVLNAGIRRIYFAVYIRATDIGRVWGAWHCHFLSLDRSAKLA